MRHSEIFTNLGCDGELLPVASTASERVVRCFLCDTEISYVADCDWVVVRYPGMRSELGE
jgi:hypothetical protein